MNKKNLTILSIALVVLLAVFFLTDTREKGAIKRGGSRLFDGTNADAIASVILTSKGTKLELKNDGNGWVLPARSGYQADLNKLRSLILKVLDLTGSQKVTSDNKHFEALGVADNSAEKTNARIQLLSQDGKELLSLLLGEPRKKGRSVAAAPGQYIRKSGDEQVYLLGDPLEISASVSNWLNAELINIPQSKVRRVIQEMIPADQSSANRTKVFELTSDGSGKFELDLQPSGNEEVQQPTVISVGGGLENVRITDVFKSDAENVKGKEFDMFTTYYLSTGAVYEVRSFSADSKIFAALSARLDPELVKENEKFTAELNEKRKAEYEEKKKAAEEAKKAEEQAAGDKEVSDSKVKFPQAYEPLKPDVVTDADIARVNERHSNWVYEFATFQGEKYRRGKADLLKAAPSEK